MKEQEKKIKKAVIKTRKAIRKKYRDLHKNKLILTEQLNEQFQPITESLNRLIDNKEKFIEKNERIHVGENESEQEIEHNNSQNVMIDEEKNQKSSIASTSGLHDMFISPETNLPSSLQVNQKPKTSHPKSKTIRSYLEMCNSNKHDNTHGIRKFRDKLYVGSQEVHLDEENLLIRKSKFEITDGLKELLFLKKPENYDDEDLNKYKQILTLADIKKQNVRNAGFKNMNIIRPILMSGEGLQLDYLEQTDKNEIEYMYWDDPNELVDRLRLLIASQSAGHTGHNNEIIAIIEELREAKIIV